MLKVSCFPRKYRFEDLEGQTPTNWRLSLRPLDVLGLRQFHFHDTFRVKV